MPSITLPGAIVSGSWLADHRDEVDVADVRWSLAEGPKRDEYRDGHLPGAVFVDLDTDLSDPPGDGGRHPLPAPSRFRSTLHRLGLGHRPVVCYDDSSGATAARMWWMLQALGMEAAVLDGGLEAWPGPLEVGESPAASSTDAGEPPPVASIDVEVEPAPTVGGSGDDIWPETAVVEVGDVLDLIGSGDVLLDARSGERFAGAANTVDPVAGHVPGARSRPWTDNIGPDGRFRSAEDLAASLAESGVEGSGAWMASCGSGVTACHNLLAARIAGLPDGRLYAGSWSEWIRDPERPVAVGDA